MEGSLESDTDLLLSLGTNIVDREEFEDNLVSRLQEHLDKQTQKETTNNNNKEDAGGNNKKDDSTRFEDGEIVDSSISSGFVENDSTVSVSEVDGIVAVSAGQASTSTPPNFISGISSSFLRDALERSSNKNSQKNSTPNVVNNIKASKPAMNVLRQPEAEETEQEKLIRLGELTPFGTLVEKSTQKK
jgi:hypothetical protein